jgi:hypothetical protein
MAEESARMIKGIGDLVLVDITGHPTLPQEQKVCRICGGKAVTAASNELFSLLIPVDGKCFMTEEFSRFALDLAGSIKKTWVDNLRKQGLDPCCTACF